MSTDDREKSNFWSSHKNPTWVWEIVFDWTRSHPEHLLWWTSEALLALHETGIYKIFAIPEIGYSSSVADPRSLAAQIKDRYQREGVIDLLYFSEHASAGYPNYEIATSIAYYGDQNIITTEDCKDLAVLQLKTQPWLNGLTNHVYHRKPIVIDGALFAPNRLNFPTVNVRYNPKLLYLRVKTYTDIWLPGVLGWNEPGFDGERRLANTELSVANGRRLNEAIRRLREITQSIGGTWRVDEDFIGQESEFDIGGVIL